MDKFIGDAPRSISTGVPGWETEAEENKLIELARQVPDGGMIVELGGEYGRSASQFLFATMGKLITVVTVDLFPMNHHIAGNLQQAQRMNLHMALGDHVARHQQVKGISWEVGSAWKNGAIDLLLIDAAHEYEAVKNDIAAWVRHVKVGGIVAFHDYAASSDSHYLHHEVKRAVDESMNLSNAFVCKGQVDSLRWYVKGVNTVVDQPTTPAIVQPQITPDDFKIKGLKLEDNRTMSQRLNESTTPEVEKPKRGRKAKSNG